VPSNNSGFRRSCFRTRTIASKYRHRRLEPIESKSASATGFREICPSLPTRTPIRPPFSKPQPQPHEKKRLTIYVSNKRHNHVPDNSQLLLSNAQRSIGIEMIVGMELWEESWDHLQRSESLALIVLLGWSRLAICHPTRVLQ
jgi:hypothetical protein